MKGLLIQGMRERASRNGRGEASRRIEAAKEIYAVGLELWNFSRAASSSF